MDFENMAEALGLTVLHIERGGQVLAKGLFMPEAIATFDDNGISATTYPDTGVFIVFKGSHANIGNSKLDQYLTEDNTTKVELVFQSRNAAAVFVLGNSGRTNDWK